MHCEERLNPQRAHRERVSGPIGDGNLGSLEVSLTGPAGWVGNVDRGIETPCEDPHSTRVVPVVVRNDDAVDLAGVHFE